MKFILSFICITTFLLFGCTPDNNPNIKTDELAVDDFYIENYNYGFSVPDSNLLYWTDDSDKRLVKFQYHNNKIIKASGGILGAAFHHENFFYNLTYDENRIYLVYDIISDQTIPPDNETIITLDNTGRIIKKTIYENYDWFANPIKDTLSYSYNSSGKLDSYIRSSVGRYNMVPTDGEIIRNLERSNLYYNRGNLDSIVTVVSSKYNQFPERIIGKYVETFGGYDLASNPFRKLIIFNNTFTRSLSKNNYTEYHKNYYPYDSNSNAYAENPTQSQFAIWSLNYDDEGEWIYDEL